MCAGFYVSKLKLELTSYLMCPTNPRRGALLLMAWIAGDPGASQICLSSGQASDVLTGCSSSPAGEPRDTAPSARLSVTYLNQHHDAISEQLKSRSTALKGLQFARTLARNYRRLPGDRENTVKKTYV